MASVLPAPSRGSNLTIGFGLVNVGVKYAPIVDPKGNRVSGKYLDPATKGPVTQQYVNEAGKVVEKVTGYPHEGEFVVLEPGDVDALKSERDQRLELKACVEPETVELLYFEKTYLVWPAKGQETSYDVLLSVLRKSGRYLVGTAVLDKSTKVVVLRYGAEDGEGHGCLLAQVCTYDANVRWNEHALVTGGIAARPAPDPDLVSLAETVFESLDDAFDFSSITDEYDERLRTLIAAKATGQPMPEVTKATPAPVVDLMSALKASLKDAKEAKPKEPKKKAAPRKRAKAA